ncbi:MAG: cyclic pyranopterin monophosphate synthase MoaC [Planctomycetes bacterium]|nr:cyclic pyranopterin monophosphate synthase MoaC [Planctomycetota bacterium]
MSSHLDDDGKAIMVDVSAKPETDRSAMAEGRIRMSKAVVAAVRANSLKKGDALAVARVAGIMAVKKTSSVIPLCHPIPVSGCEIEFVIEDESIFATCTVWCRYCTGVEMEALNGVTTALLTIYDMCKSIDKAMEIFGIRLLRKTGGKSGDYRRKSD